MKIRYVAIIALALSIGPVGWGLLARHIATALMDAGTPYETARLAGLIWICFPFFFAAAWALTNMEKYETGLSRLFGRSGYTADQSLNPQEKA